MEVAYINNLSEDEFVKLFGNIVESFPKAADYLYTKVPFKSIDFITEEALLFLDFLTLAEKETILKLHPDLAGKLADKGELTSESTEEQKAAGLDKLSVEHKKELNNLNKQYKTKFNIPFVICARENKADTILKGLRIRLNSNKTQELITGINEVKKICKLRIDNILQNK